MVTSIIKKILLPVIFLLAISHSFCSAQSQSIPPSNILIINSYTSITQWSDNLIAPIYLKYTAHNNNVNIYTEHMNMLTINNDEALKQYKLRFARKYAKLKPQLIILLGTSAWVLLKEDIEKKWKDIPTIICCEKRYIGSKEAYLKKSFIPQNERIPLNSYQGDIPLTIFQVPCYVKETLELMKTLYPKMHKLVFLSDGRFINAQYRHEVDEVMRTQFPDVQVKHLVAGKITNDDLIDSLKHLDFPSCILFSSWYSQTNQQGNLILSSDISKVLSNYSKVPIFTLNNNNVAITNGILGGCYQREDILKGKLLETIEQELKNPHSQGIQTIEMPPVTPILNYPDLENWELDINLCPPNTYFYNTPPTFLEKNWFYIIPIAFLAICLYIIWLKKLAKERNARLNAMEEYNSLFKNMPIIYIKEELIYNKEGRVIDFIFKEVNPTFEKYITAKSNILGKKYSETSGQHTRCIDLYNSLQNKKELSFQYYWEAKHIYLTVIITCSPKKGFLDVFCVDNTELAQVQQILRSTNHKLSTALDVANITPWKWDLEKHTILCDVNRPIEISGNNSPAEEQQLSVPDSSYFSNICKQDIDRVRNAYQSLIEGKVPRIKEEFRVISNKGYSVHYEWVEVQATIDEYNQAGKAKTLVGSSLIITQRKAMENDLIKAKEKAEESNKLKSAFLANMSHEIRTPLNAIVGFSGILASMNSDIDEEKQEYIQIIENNNNLLLQLINDILDLSKIEAGVLEFSYNNINVDELFMDIEESTKMRNQNKNVCILYKRTLPSCYISTDKNRLTQVITNMINNAMKFTQRGSIEFGYNLQNEDSLYFYVSDTGCGIPESQVNRVFERFVKLNNFAQGTGLGLPICQTIITSMGGKIGVKSKEGEGSTFWFTLPYHQADQAGDNIAKAPETPRLVDKKDKLVILIAEDNESNYKLFETILKKNYTLIHAWDGEEAVQLFKQHNPHLVLMDINMPKMDGYEATQKIREISPDVPVMAITAFAYAEDEQHILNSGFNAYTSKPIQAEQLQKQIGNLLKKHFLFLY